MNTANTYSDIPLLDLLSWCQAYLPETIIDSEVLAGDAGFRRYVRIFMPSGTAIAVFSPPALEKNTEFVTIAKLLASYNVAVPAVRATALELGYLLLSDLGQQQLMPLLTDAGVDHWYPLALLQIRQLQSIPTQVCALAHYDRAELERELGLFPQWFVQQLLGLAWPESLWQPFQAVVDLLLESALAEPQVLVHRDYHCRNLMVQNQQLALIDFQDAVIGPASYDVVSLLKDCYVMWPRSKVLTWLQHHWTQSTVYDTVDTSVLLQQFDWMGLQRHLKVLGVFARLSLRDGKHRYLEDLPMVLAYVMDTLSRYPQFAPMAAYFEQTIMPACRQQPWFYACEVPA